ncbi:MAG TPA: LON peptidase substrate-binding domain-containing protein [Candidatus Acidoferrum sp.]|nr:LON peptidase substrate-binding domain-containing protein [Candidatus Acidoferrum sp.]
MELPTRIPIFPLNVVLFPGMPLPLHIFEPRYKRMVRHCLGEALRFGVILATEKGIATVGTTAEITKKIQEYPDGRMDILTVGHTVFSVQGLFDSEQYYEARVEYPKDSLHTEDHDERSAVVEQFNHCHILLFGQHWPAPATDDSVPLSYRLAALLPLELVEKQHLLEARSEHDRRKFLQTRMERLTPQLVERNRVRRAAGGNGHPLN